MVDKKYYSPQELKELSDNELDIALEASKDLKAGLTVYNKYLWSEKCLRKLFTNISNQTL